MDDSSLQSFQVELVYVYIGTYTHTHSLARLQVVLGYANSGTASLYRNGTPCQYCLLQ